MAIAARFLGDMALREFALAVAKRDAEEISERFS